MATAPLAYTVKVTTWNDTNKSYDTEFFNFPSQDEAKVFWNEQKNEGKRCRFIHHRLFLRTDSKTSPEKIKDKYPSTIHVEKKNDQSYILFFKTDEEKKNTKPVESDKLFRFRTVKPTPKPFDQQQISQS